MATRSVRALLAVCLSLAAFLFVRPGCLVASPQAPAPAARPAAPPAGPERVTSVEGVTEYRLSAYERFRRRRTAIPESPRPSSVTVAGSGTLESVSARSPC